MKPIQVLIILFSMMITFLSKESFAQSILVNASLIDGVDINKENILSYQIISRLKNAVTAQVTGTITYRGSDLRLSYTFNQTIQPGVNSIDAGTVHPMWTYSQNALRELFVNYNTLPAGTYQYCIQVLPKAIIGETDPGNMVEECVYHKNQELFLINLIEPENNAKIYEHNPAFTWVANYSFSNELTYKIRVAEIRKGQNTESAISRNNPIYQENELRQNTLIYPMYAKELETYQPYAWTVDAYYHGILLGGAEPWRFTIIDDSIGEVPTKDMSYIEANIEDGTNTSLIAGKIKIKFIEKEHRSNSLQVSITDADNKPIKGFNKNWDVEMGENRVEYDLSSLELLKHRKVYSMVLKDSESKIYTIRFKYFNPAFIK
jgi:hypothetical protein